MGSAFKHRASVLTLAILLACFPCAFSLNPSLDVNQYAHTAWKVREGFSRGAITSITQTPDGYIWMGTQFGLMRFDGVRNIPWPENQRLPSSYVLSLFAARDGTLWIGTTKGLASWKDGKLTQYAELAERFIFSIVQDAEGTIWASGMAPAAGKLCAIRNSNVQCYGEDGSLGRGAFNLYADSKGNLWAGVKTGLWRWRPGPPKFYPLAGEIDGIQALGEDADGTLLIGWKGGISRFVDGKTKPYLLPGISRKFVARRILRNRDGDLWIGTYNQGLVHVHQERTDIFAQPEGLSSDSTLVLFEDREGSIWVATLNGLDRFREFAVPTFSVKQGMSHSLVTSIVADRQGVVWLSTVAGLDTWKNGKISTYDQRGGKLNGLAPNSLFQDDHGRLWISTQDAFGYLDNNRFIPVKDLPGGIVLSIAQDRAGNLWLANEHLGLFKVSPANSVQKIPWPELGHKDHASVLAADRSRDGLWIGFFSGGIAYFADGQVRESYTSSHGLSQGRISSFQFDDDGATLWISTESGLSRLKNGRLITLTSKDGLPCDGVNWVKEDDDHSLWLYMPCGLARIDRAALDAWISGVEKNNHPEHAIQLTFFDSLDGVRSLAESGHYSPPVAKSPDGKLWFLPWDGVSVIDPRHIRLNRLPPPVRVEQVTANQTTYDPASATNGAMQLPPLVRALEIDYTALSFVAPEKVFFRYKLENFDRDWQEAGTRRQAFYNNLSPGNYHFRVIACNNSGIWNEEGATFDFSIAPAYYQTAWFRALCVAVFAAFLWALFQLRQWQMQHQFNMRLEARVHERMRIARELHDTLLQSFHGLMFRFQAARNMLPRRPEEAMQALDGAISRAEQAIAESRNAIQDLRSATAGQADLAQSLTAIGQELAARNGNHDSPLFQVIVEGERRKLAPVFQDEAYRMGRELLQNAFQHACAHEIEVEIRYDHRMFRLRIRDDGKGIDPRVLEQGGRRGHWGLPGVRERAQQIGAQLDFWSEAGAGTEIQLTVPAHIAYAKSQDSSGLWPFGKTKGNEQS